MSSLVYQNNFNYVHHNPQHVLNIKLEQKKNDFSKIQSRYLDMLRATWGEAEANGVKYKNIDELLQSEQTLDFAEIEGAIQQEIAEGINLAFDSPMGGDTPETTVRSLITLANQLNKQRNNKTDFLETINKILAIIDGDAKGIQSWRKIAENTALPQFLSAQDVTFAKRLRAQLGRAGISGSAKNFHIPTAMVNDIRANVSEWVGAFAAYCSAEQIKKVDQEIIKSFKSAVKSGKVKFTGAFGQESFDVGEEGEILSTFYSKASDSKIQEYVSLEYGPSSQNSLQINAKINTDISSKMSLQNEKMIKLTSYGGTNSLVMKGLEQAGVLNSAQSYYATYNGLAFSYRDGSAITQDNYRIIRSSLIQEMGEKFIVGATAENTQRILVINDVAYPILGIISAIVEEASNRAEDDPYGHNEDLFNIYIENAGEENEWVGSDSKNLTFAVYRSNKVINKIKALKATGRINTSKLNTNLLGEFKNVQGIKLNLAT